MKKIFLIISFIGMSTIAYGQSTPTPPTPPVANAGTTGSGITYSYSETNTSLAISLSYKESLKQGILNIVSANFPQFNGSQYINDNAVYYQSITSEGNSLKIELRTKNNVPASNQNFQKAKLDTKKMYNEIYAL